MDQWSCNGFAERRPVLHKFQLKSLPAVNVGECALLGPMMVMWLS
jgi:hypothetical protein